MAYRLKECPELFFKKPSKIQLIYLVVHRNTSSFPFEKARKIAQCYKELNLPNNSKQEDVRKAFIELAKRFHPDSGSPEADVDKFCAIENAFRVLSKHNTGSSNTVEMESIIIDIKHTAPQHRQYLSFEGVGYGTPFQRQKQWAQARAQKATENVMEHRLSKALASENTIMKKGEMIRKHDIKTKYGFDRVVEDLIQESISKGEFDNLSGKGKPLKDQNINPYVDYSTHKLNEVLINNGFIPEWITMRKDIEENVEVLKKDLVRERKNVGPFPLTDKNKEKWLTICDNNRKRALEINVKINSYNIMVPLLNKQKFHIDYEEICNEVLRSGEFLAESDVLAADDRKEPTKSKADDSDSVLTLFFNMVGQVFSELLKVKKKGERI